MAGQIEHEFLFQMKCTGVIMISLGVSCDKRGGYHFLLSATAKVVIQGIMEECGKN